MSVAVTTRVVHNEVPSDMYRAEGAIWLFAAHMAGHVKSYMSLLAPVGQTGALKESFDAKLISRTLYWITSSVDYAEWVRTGTGVYYVGTPIMPESAGALKFFWPKVGMMTVWKGDLPDSESRAQFIEWAWENGMMPFLTWPKGQPPQDYVTPALAFTEARSRELLHMSLEEMGVA